MTPRPFHTSMDVTEISPEFNNSYKTFKTTLPILNKLIKGNGDRKKLEDSRRTINQCVSNLQI